MAGLVFDPLYLWLGAATGLSVMLIALFLPSYRHLDTDARLGGNDKPVSFLFRNNQLVDLTEAAHDLIGEKLEYQSFAENLSQRFPDLTTIDLEQRSTVHIPASPTNDPAFLEVTKSGERLRITLHDPASTPSDRHKWLAADTQRSIAEAVIEKAPVAAWVTNTAGDIVSSNTIYREIADLCPNGQPFVNNKGFQNNHQESRRLAIASKEGDRSHWFDVTTRPIPPDLRVHYAVSADAIVNAEVAQRNFVQTLTKTFAQLSIGLAIFDRKRQLALFNPALIDLTTLPADFLSARPSLNGFFDQLRDRQIMPEPRNYKTWRDQLSDMILAAQDGQYCETWTLPSGLTYRVSGKPHPDGAIAFLFEDISAEVSLTRRFRSELELSQSALDALDSSVAIFANTGALTFANDKFRRMWKCSPDESFIEMTVLDASKIWQGACNPSPVWGDIRDFVTRMEDRSAWQSTVTHHDLGQIVIVAQPLSGGATMVRFHSAHDTSEDWQTNAVNTADPASDITT